MILESFETWNMEYGETYACTHCWWHCTLGLFYPDSHQEFWNRVSSTRGQTAEARTTTVLQPVKRKQHSQKDRQDEKEEGYMPDEGTR